MAKHIRVLSGGAVPPLVSELVLTLTDDESCAVPDARQQKWLLSAPAALGGAEGQGAAGGLGAGAWQSQPPA